MFYYTDTSPFPLILPSNSETYKKVMTQIKNTLIVIIFLHLRMLLINGNQTTEKHLAGYFTLTFPKFEVVLKPIKRI